MYFVEAQLSEHISETPQGFLLCEGVAIARTGSQEYLAREIGLDELPPNTVVTVDRLEDDVMTPEVLASFEGITLTLGHPTHQVTVDNWRALSMGHLQNIRRGEGAQSHLILADMLIKDANTIAQVKPKNGLRQVSCGYDCQYVQDEAGNWRQTNIRGNHVAIVPRGRAGPECSIKDSIMSKVADTVRKIFGRAQDEAAAAVLEGEAAVAAATGAPAKDGEGVGFAVDASILAAVADGKVVGVKVVDGKIVMAEDADMSGIVADLMERLGYMERAKAETDATVDGLRAAIVKLTEGEPAAAADAAVTLDAETIARAEILAPGVAMAPGVELAALTAAYATDAGKKVIDLLSGGKGPTADTAAALFLPAAELLKAQRATSLTVPIAPVADVQTADATIKKINAKSATIHPLY